MNCLLANVNYWTTLGVKKVKDKQHAIPLGLLELHNYIKTKARINIITLVQNNLLNRRRYRLINDFVV